MFNSTPDPSWHYTPLWEEMREIYFKTREIEMKLSHRDAENQNDEVDKFVQENLIKIREIANNWIYDVPEDYEPPTELN